MKEIKKIFFCILIFLLLTITSTSFASEKQEREYLLQLLNQLDAMQPLIIAAEKEQPKNLRVQFHYTKFKDSEGQIHNGLLEDIEAIRGGIKEKLNETQIEPRVVTPIAGDYVPEGDKNS
jgi:RAQPRD family integrative conjugative element protein